MYEMPEEFLQFLNRLIENTSLEVIEIPEGYITSFWRCKSTKTNYIKNWLATLPFFSNSRGKILLKVKEYKEYQEGKARELKSIEDERERIIESARLREEEEQRTEKARELERKKQEELRVKLRIELKPKLIKFINRFLNRTEEWFQDNVVADGYLPTDKKKEALEKYILALKEAAMKEFPDLYGLDIEEIFKQEYIFKSDYLKDLYNF